MKIFSALLTKPSVNVWFLGTLGYQPAYRIQQLLAAQHSLAAPNQANTLIIVEHKPVYTIGIRTAGYDESEEQRLINLGAEFYRTNRGGLITFHGPGQLVAYPILNLNGFTKSMKWYICKLEETIIQMCKSSFGIKAVRSSDTGVWVDNNKICAIGVHGRRYVTTHGLALNCDVDLKWFTHVVPCGIRDKGVTSLTSILERNVPTKDVIVPFLDSFAIQFSCNLNPTPFGVKNDLVKQLVLEKYIDSTQGEKIIQSSC